MLKQEETEVRHYVERTHRTIYRFPPQAIEQVLRQHIGLPARDFNGSPHVEFQLDCDEGAVVTVTTVEEELTDGPE
jgi:hypothetical protein